MPVYFYLFIVLQLQNNREGSSFYQRFLFPLCGKSLDVAWVYKKGHTVIGIEAVASVVEELYKEADICYKKSYHKGIDGWIYEVNISLYSHHHHPCKHEYLHYIAKVKINK